jgi:predicted secreted protein
MAPYAGSKAFAGQGTILSVGDGASAETFTPVAEVKTIKRSGSKADQADVTNMDSVSAYREYIPTLLDAGEIQFEGNYIPHDETQQNLQTLFDRRTLSNWEITLPESSIEVAGNTKPGVWSFHAFVNGSPEISLDVAKETTFSAKLKVTGKPVFTDETA